MNRSPLSVVRPLLVGGLAFAVLVGGLGLWSATVPIAGAVVAEGAVAVDGSRRPVQHPDGGTVEAVFVREGDRVEAGAALLRFDGRLLRTERAVVAGQLSEIAARRARLEAERDGRAGPVVPDGLEPADRALFEGQAQLFAARQAAAEGRTRQLRERIAQIEAEIRGTEARARALAEERALVAEDAAAQERLLARGLTQRARLTALRRDIARIDGDLGELAARIARLRAEIAETRLAIIALADDRREEAVTELRDLALREAELRERLLGIDGTLARLDVRAPVSGIVLGLGVRAAGAVVRPAETMLDLVPEEAGLLVEIRVRGTDRDAIRPGQEARLRFAAFDPRTTPEIPATVLRVSPDALVDEVTGQAYYSAALRPEPGALADLPGDGLVPGMPAEAFVVTGERTALAYLLGPLEAYFARAFREG